MTRSSAIRAATLGSIASAALMIYAGRNSPQRLIIALFVVWVVFPFFAMLVASMPARQWPELRQRVLYRFMIAASVMSVLIYAIAAFVPLGQRPTPIFVMAAPVCVLSLAVVLLVSARMSRQRHE